MSKKPGNKLGERLGLAAMGMVLALQASAADAPKPETTKAEAVKALPTPQDIVNAAPPSAWRDVKAENLVVMTLNDGTQVLFELAPQFTPVHTDNIVKLIRSGWFDGAAIIRVNENYVVQWGRPDEDPRQPEGIVTLPPAEYEMPLKGLDFSPLPYKDTFAAKVGFVDGWPVASDGKTAWLTHCYSLIGVARDVAPDTGSGTQLYTVIGQAPRGLDRNLAVVGRVLKGMETLTARPRGTEVLGFYKTPAERTPIVSVKMAIDLPADQRPALQVMATGTPTFAAWIKAKANRTGSFWVRQAGAIDLCNALPPVRTAPKS